MRQRHLVTITLLEALLFSGWTSNADAHDGERRGLQRDLAQILDATGAPGAAALVARAGEVTLRARAGTDDFGQRPLPHDGAFRIASATKTFTAVVILQLVDEGKLALDDTVEARLPGVVRGDGYDGDRITIRDLLRHQSGIANYLDAPRFSERVGTSEAFDAHRCDENTEAAYVSDAFSLPPLFEPGASFGYSNTNYVLLGMIIEAVTHTSWGEQIQRRIAAPLGLRDTRVAGGDAALPNPHVHGWMRFPDEDAYVDVTDERFLIGADAGVISTLADLTAFFRALMRGALLSPELLAAMKDTIPIDYPDFPDARYGLGLQWSALSCGGGYWHHTGDTFGYTVRTGVLPDGSRSAALVINGALESQRAVEAASQLIDHALCAGALQP